MRDRIVRIIAECEDEYYAQETASPEKITDQILSLICEEIENGLLTGQEIDEAIMVACMRDKAVMGGVTVALAQLQKILALLKEG